ncbi:hypothetical protein EOW77_0032905 [Bradyrhizobium yuanmingense]|uniref:hypothetical protein n=1 Tax=Bradyrhizobium yuanmingense TaxID=108015 RepID=UPI000FE39853|nr:hypothetical protein [Bradyrhizobium yuanmingense]TGN75190.1 hypothetical protein EOW77_0032905 [Bradyrhizobium yuanmingense]
MKIAKSRLLRRAPSKRSRDVHDHICPDLAVLPDPARHSWLRQNLRKGIILSDPYTIGIVQATIGAPAAYLFSDLDTVNEMIATGAKPVVRTILQPAEGDQRLENTCSLIAPLVRVVLHHSCRRRDKSC